jgi:hypothetical protein
MSFAASIPPLVIRAAYTPTGFAALAVYDQPAHGGNGGGIIHTRDAIFSSLRPWIDLNHDGISQTNEVSNK